MDDFNFNSRNFGITVNKSDLHEKPKKEEKKQKPEVKKPKLVDVQKKSFALTRAPTLSEASTESDVVFPLNKIVDSPNSLCTDSDMEELEDMAFEELEEKAGEELEALLKE